MPNWCFSNYFIEGDKEDIADLMQKLQSLKKKEASLVPNDFGKNWLGNVVALFGGDPNEVPCRGEFMDIERASDTDLCFHTETAWSEMRKVWDFVCGKYKNLRYYFCAEESGCCYYATNDREGKYFSERFIVVQREEGTEYHDTEEELFLDISVRCGTVVNNMEELQKATEEYNASHEDNEIHVHGFEITD